MKIKLSWTIYFATIIIMLAAQTSFFPQFEVFQVKPDLVLLFVISVGLIKGCDEGIRVGALAGITAGIVSSNIWGLYFLVYCLAGFGAGLIREKIEPDNFLIPLLCALLGSAGLSLIFSLLGPFLDIFTLDGDDLYKSLVFAGINTAFAIPVFLASKYILAPPDRGLKIKTPVMQDSILME